jgi:hypothetical protein
MSFRSWLYKYVPSNFKLKVSQNLNIFGFSIDLEIQQLSIKITFLNGI